MRDNGKGGVVTCINVIRFVGKIIIGKLKEKRLHWRNSHRF
jgi:hypothetical protein